MNVPLLSNLPPVGESVAKLASGGGQGIVDLISIYGFFIFCLAFVSFCLLVPFQIYEKRYKIEDDEPTVGLDLKASQSTDPAA
ncbi:hypothetical protein [Cohnella hongkongensis]|uniref:Uncharacterized protein n=1 Tax=Cohnella hongkongensis TaxID=178337 RepID=A0ABV9FJ12_9BACL